jgi:methyl-accepting chemotaxis protein
MLTRRKIFLINRKFQFRFSFYVCSWLFALSMIYPLIIFQLFDFFVRSAAIDPMGPALEKLYHARNEVIWLLIGIQTFFLAITFLISLFVSHRIAGPLEKLKRYFEAAKNGDLKTDLKFRKFDHFQELAQGYNDMMEAVRKKLGN